MCARRRKSISGPPFVWPCSEVGGAVGQWAVEIRSGERESEKENIREKDGRGTKGDWLRFVWVQLSLQVGLS